MKWIVNNPDGYATRLTGFAGTNLTLVNSGATDVYYDVEAVGGTINSTAPGVVPIGTILKGGATPPSQVQFFNAPNHIWVRAATQTTLDVQSDASTQAIVPTVLAGDNRGNLNVTPTSEFPKKQISIGAPTMGRFFKGLERKYFHKRTGD